MDCRILFDHLGKLTAPASLFEKRVAVDIQNLKEAIDLRNHRWCPTHDQLAGVFTKIGAAGLYARLKAGIFAPRCAEVPP